MYCKSYWNQNVNRRDLLLREAARAFDRGDDPLSPWWLRVHEVTEVERLALSDWLAAIILGFLLAPDELRAGVMRCYATGVLAEEIGDD
jgi:hypothetical protein